MFPASASYKVKALWPVRLSPSPFRSITRSSLPFATWYTAAWTLLCLSPLVLAGRVCYVGCPVAPWKYTSLRRTPPGVRVSFVLVCLVILSLLPFLAPSVSLRQWARFLRSGWWKKKRPHGSRNDNLTPCSDPPSPSPPDRPRDGDAPPSVSSQVSIPFSIRYVYFADHMHRDLKGQKPKRTRSQHMALPKRERRLRRR